MMYFISLNKMYKYFQLLLTTDLISGISLFWNSKAYHDETGDLHPSWLTWSSFVLYFFHCVFWLLS